MRTTIRLPDELYVKVRESARGEGITVTAFIERSLQRALGAKAERPAPAYRVDVFHGDGLLPGVDLDDNDALEEVMGGDDVRR
jgi:hypothetical protein